MTALAEATAAPAPPSGPSGPLARMGPSWPLALMLGGYPLWWLLGVGDLIVPVMAVPMVVQLIKRGRVRLPPGWWLWGLFLVWALIGVVVLGVHAPGTLASSGSSRIPGFMLRAVTYFSATVVVVWATTLSATELPRRRIVNLIGLFFLYCVAGGLLGLLDPHFAFTSPLEHLLPKSIDKNQFVKSLVHPIAAQVQNVFGATQSPRPAAPFGYTNTWGNNLSVTLPFFVVSWLLGPLRWRRWAGAVVLVAAAVPVVYSLNRGLWIGLGVSVAYLALRQLLAGKLGVPLLVLAGVVVASLALVATPLGTVVTARLQHGNSNSIRANLSHEAVQMGLESPILGFGSDRLSIGSVQSLAVGRSAACPTCGNAAIGSNGQLWLLLAANGLVGTALYCLFFAFPLWRFRRDRAPDAMAAHLVVLLSFVYMFVYTSAATTLAVTMLSVALLRRRELDVAESPRYADLWHGDGSRPLAPGGVA